MGKRYTSSGGCLECLGLSRTITNTRERRWPVLEVPIPADLAVQFRKFSDLILRRDPSAVLHLNLAVPPTAPEAAADEPVIHVDTESGLAYELIDGEWVRYRGAL